jgi:hypothetical protein
MKKLYILIAIFSFLFPLAAQATVAGKVSYHSGEAWALRDGERVALQQGVEVHSGDVIVTTISGRAKFSMVDKSVVYVGRQSRITIDQYEMREGSLFSGSFNMLWGKVRFLVTKLNSSRANFSVKTKTATIGVRGTQFAVMLDKPTKPKQLVPTTVMLFEGAVVAKSVKGQVTNIKPGTIVHLKPNGIVQTRKIEKRDLKILDIEHISLEKGSRNPGKLTRTTPTERGSLTGTTSTKQEPLTLTSPTKLAPTTTLTSPTKLAPTTTLTSPTRLAPTTIVPTTTIKPPTTTIKPPTTTIKPPTTTIKPPTTTIKPPTTTIKPPTTTIKPPPVYVPPTTTIRPPPVYVPPTTTIKPPPVYVPPTTTIKGL